MRPDLAKLTTEKERRGSWKEAKKYGGRVKVVHSEDHDYEEEFGGFHSSARRRAYGWDCKEFSDVLSPLRGALRANLGRPWDKVYSEFCQFLDRRSMAGIHIFSHLVGFRSTSLGGEVEIRGLYVGDDKKVYQHSDSRYSKDSEVSGFYVHPVTGILKYAPYKHGQNRDWKAEQEIKELRDSKVSIDGRDYEVIDGCWFETWYTSRSVTSFNPCYVQDKEKKWYDERGYVQHHKTHIWRTWHTQTKVPVLSRRRSLSKKQIKVVKQYIEDRIQELTQ